jgi:precorrin-6B methylase 2
LLLGVRDGREGDDTDHKQGNAFHANLSFFGDSRILYWPVPLKFILLSSFLGVMLATIGGTTPSFGQQAAPAPLRAPDVIYLPTPRDVVTAMLKVANVGSGDVVYDLGSGDGRIVIAAVKEFGAARGTGIDIDPARVSDANDNASRAGVTDRVHFINQDLFETDLSEATVVTLYLLPWLNRKLMPKLMAELKPGSRVVSYRFDMGSWKPDQALSMNGQMIYFWTIPARR